MAACKKKKRERKKGRKKKAPFIGFYTFSCRLKKRHFTHFFFNLHFSSPALGSDEDYHVDIIHELDLANATYGITQVAGLHNGSKAFIFRGNAYTLTLSSFVVKFRLSLFSRLHRRTHTAFIHTDTHTHAPTLPLSVLLQELCVSTASQRHTSVESQHYLCS